MMRAKSAKRWIRPLVRYIALKQEIARSDFVVVSIKKSGRTWLRAMLTRLFHNCYGTPTDRLLDGANHKRLNPCAPSVLFTHDSDPVANENKVAARLSAYNGGKVILLVRNPADVIVSLYHHYKNRKTGKRQKIAAESTIYEFATRRNHGIHTIISFLNRWAEYARNKENVMVVSYENMHRDPAAHLAKIAEYLGVNASREEINEAVGFASLENLRRLELEGFFDDRSLRKVDGSNPEAFKVRRGRVSGYKDYFSAAECDAIERIMRSDLDPFFGYENMPAKSSPGRSSASASGG